jgi:hypothetical protein
MFSNDRSLQQIALSMFYFKDRLNCMIGSIWIKWGNMFYLREIELIMCCPANNVCYVFVYVSLKSIYCAAFCFVYKKAL